MDFLAILMLFIVTCMVTFFLLGNNQYYNLISSGTPEDQEVADSIMYKSIGGSFKFIYLIMLGEGSLPLIFGEAGNAALNNEDVVWMWVLFFLATFFLIIHLMSMLIAILSDSVAELDDIEEQII